MNDFENENDELLEDDIEVEDEPAPRKTKKKDSFLNEVVTIPGIVLSVINSRGKRMRKKQLFQILIQFSERDLEEAITFLHYKSLLHTDNEKANGDCDLSLSF